MKLNTHTHIHKRIYTHASTYTHTHIHTHTHTHKFRWGGDLRPSAVAGNELWELGARERKRICVCLCVCVCVCVCACEYAYKIARSRCEWGEDRVRRERKAIVVQKRGNEGVFHGTKHEEIEKQRIESKGQME